MKRSKIFAGGSMALDFQRCCKRLLHGTVEKTVLFQVGTMVQLRTPEAGVDRS
jgi:hypothetical protein